MKPDKFTLQQIKQKYEEYKEILEEGNREIWSKYTPEQLEIMRNIVDQLDDMGFPLIVKSIN